MNAVASSHDFKVIDDAARAFLRSVRINGGKKPITREELARAQKCRMAGYVHITEKNDVAKLTGHGQAYLDRLMRAH